MLTVDSINTFYGQSHVLYDVSFRAAADEVVALLGRNGVGKTTTIRSVIGLTPPRSGTIRFDGEDITRRDPSDIANAGMGYVPQERGLFPNLTVKENLRMGLGRAKFDEQRMSDLFEYFPRVEERLEQRAGTLSGGERQMVAMARGLMRNPKLLLLDEPTEGLMPSLIPEITDITQDIAEQGHTIVIVEQNVDLVLQLADRVYLMESGRIKDETTPAEIESNEEILQEYLGV